MEFKYINDKNKTPQSKSQILSSTVNRDRFSSLPNDISTPPSRFAKIFNPFEHRLIDRLHLPTFSPSVFAQQSTPNKTDEKFQWTIDEISVLKPANIDEATISQHVFDEDPDLESLMQQKIKQFFSEEVIVPSPIVDVVRVPLIADTSVKIFTTEPKEYTEGSTQTMLSLPPVLPAQVEEILKPYFLPTENKTDMRNTTLFRNLFNNDENTDDSIVISFEDNFSPVRPPVELNSRHSLPTEFPDLHDCSLSPIGEDTNRSNKNSKLAVRLDFSSTSMDVSLIVPDIGNLSSPPDLLGASQCLSQTVDDLSDSPVNWDMENEHISFSTKMDMSNANTPRSKPIASQRKRLSRSFNTEEIDLIKGSDHLDVGQARKFFRNDTTDAGYHTENPTFNDECDSNLVNMFASTPTKF